MAGSLGSCTLPHRVASDPVTVILFPVNASSCLVSSLVVNDAMGIVHQVLFWNWRNVTILPTGVHLGRKAGCPERLTGPRERGERPAEIWAQSLCPPQVGERVYLNEYPLD